MSRVVRSWRWELTLVALTLLAGTWASMTSPFYLSADQIGYALQDSIGVAGLIAAGLMAVVVVAEIDISLPAIMALGNMLFASLALRGVPIGLALPLVLLVATAAGLLNGFLVTTFGLPSLAVTLGALGAYRALALLLGGQESFAGFPDSYIWLGSALIGGTMPVSLLLLVLVFVALAVVMHGTVFGRHCYVVGANARAAAFSGVPARRAKVAAFGLGGLSAGLASLAYIGQYQSARADNASDMLLFIVTAVVLGGVDIFGGRGRVVGVLLALLLLGTLKNGMGLANFAGPVQTLVIGTLLVAAVLIGQADTSAFKEAAMDEKLKIKIEDWARAHEAGRVGRRAWLKRMLDTGLSLPAIAAVLAQTGVAVGRADAQTRLRIFNVPKFTGFIFFELAKNGGQKACDELGAQQTYVGTTTADVEGQVQVLRNIVPQKPDGIVTAALDVNAPVPVLRQARRRGAVVVTFDSDVAQEGRDAFVNMAAFETQARAMLESALFNVPTGGKSIWVAPTPTVANFISQKKALDALIASDPRYKSIQFIDTLYANDDPEKSYQVATSAMQAHPDLELFISGSGISNPAINKAIKDTGRSGKVYATGFALPSTMKTYLEDGTCKQYALWSPYKFGYMATYLAIMLKSGKIEHKPGVTVEVPTIGKRELDSTFTANLNNMLFFRKGHDDFDNAIPMPA